MSLMSLSTDKSILRMSQTQNTTGMCFVNFFQLSWKKFFEHYLIFKV